MKIIKRNRIEVTAVRYFLKKPFKMIIILNMTFTGLHMKKQQFILLNHMQRITVKCMKYYNNVYFIVNTGTPIPAADIRISGARSRMDMLTDYFEAAATSKICLSGTRGSA